MSLLLFSRKLACAASQALFRNSLTVMAATYASRARLAVAVAPKGKPVTVRAGAALTARRAASPAKKVARAASNKKVATAAKRPKKASTATKGKKTVAAKSKPKAKTAVKPKAKKIVVKAARGRLTAAKKTTKKLAGKKTNMKLANMKTAKKVVGKKDAKKAVGKKRQNKAAVAGKSPMKMLATAKRTVKKVTKKPRRLSGYQRFRKEVIGRSQGAAAAAKAKNLVSKWKALTDAQREAYKSKAKGL